MKVRSFLIFLCLGLLLLGCNPNNKSTSSPSEGNAPNKQHKFAIALHAGAGSIVKEHVSDSLEQAYKAKLKEAITTGQKILKEGGKAEEAVKATINVLENSPLFNAGKGAVLNHEEKPALDAAIMDGKTLNAGAVSGVSHIKNPIDLAISVMKNSKHVMLYGEGAEEFAWEQGFEKTPISYFITQKRLDQVRAVKKAEKKKASEKKVALYEDPILKAAKYGTVGCVALDQDGNLAAGTSTGGLTDKRYGRIGDSPIIGAGTYANNQTCAVSCTGIGEYYIRGVVAYDMSALMQYKGLTVSEATHKIIHEKQPEIGGTGGIIAMDHYGNVSFDFNTPGMFRASMDDAGHIEIGLYGSSEH